MLTTASTCSGLRLSICILTCNRDQLLEPLLLELVRQVDLEDEVVVLDTGRNDSTRAIVAGVRSSQIIYSQFPMKLFDFATARNELIRLASRDAIVFIDDDAFPFPDWLSHVRKNLEKFAATGGITVADGEMPEWWDPAINWCIGLSPPGTVLGMPGYYPDTCNLAANIVLWRTKPFEVVSRQDRQLYATGREDAEWWLDRRLEGCNISTDYRQAVAHHIHSDRLSFKYIKQRARNDGVSSWLRRPAFEAATAIPWDLAHIAGVVADQVVRCPLDRQGRLADIIWLNRQWGKFISVWNYPDVTRRPPRREQLRQLAKAAAFQLRIRAGKAVFNTVSVIRHRKAYPASAPESIFVSADCHVGDSVLLRPHVQALALTFPDATIHVSCKNPLLLTCLAPNVQALAKTEMSACIKRNNLNFNAAIVPYFPFGDDQLWREKLSQIGTTFDCDVSFQGRRDYHYARRLVPKNLELHEHENLTRLFRLWPLRTVEEPAPPQVPEADGNWLYRALREKGISDRYVVVQFGAGHDFKEWPLDCWIPFLSKFCKAIDLPVLLIGGSTWSSAADVAVQEVRHKPGIINMIPGTDLGRLMVLVQRAAFLVGGCSGPKHLAIAYRVPTFILYAATEPERWGAARDHHLHAYIKAIPQKFTAMEIQGLDRHHRSRLLDPLAVAEAAINHYYAVAKSHN